MFHYVFLDPATIDEAVAAGEMGLGRLIELLESFRKDVILAETDSWRFTDEVGERVRAIPDTYQNERKQIQDILIWMNRNSPMLLLEGDDGSKALLEFAQEKASDTDLDMILSPGDAETSEETWVKVCLTKAHTTELSERRARLIKDGLQFAKGSKNYNEIASECFSKLVMHAEYIRVYDYALGEYYNNDQPENLKRLVRFLRDNTQCLVELEINTLSKSKASLDRNVRDLGNEVDFKINIQYKDRKEDLPHPRYLGADQRYLDIDRGIDMCDSHDKCRMTQIKYAANPA